MVDAPPRRCAIVFFGTPAFAVPTLDALLAARRTPSSASSRSRIGRAAAARRSSDAPVKARALAAGVPVLQPERLKDPAFLDALAAWNADLGVVAAYGKILTDAVLAIPRLGMINVHASLLPRYRGAAPVHRAVIAGERRPASRSCASSRRSTPGRCSRRRAGRSGRTRRAKRSSATSRGIGAGLLVAVVDRIAARHRRRRRRRTTRAATYAHRLTKDDGVDRLDAGRRRAIHNLIRGLHPWPHAFTFLGGKRLILQRSAIGRRARTRRRPRAGHDRSRQPAIDLHRRDRRRARSRIVEIQAEGKRPMSAREFLAGHRLAAGDRLHVRAMIAPARVAAYDILARRLRRQRRSADGDRAGARAACTTTAIARSPPRSPPASSAGAPRSII